ncbi:MAG: tetratricopeptide repeat protein [Desulfobacterales bacterium]|nr:tetratricopeptide repeat protein [Desulfobacterales bacterium]
MSETRQIDGMDPQIANRLRVAVACHQDGDLDRAEAGYRQILAVEPDHGDALHLLGLVHLHRGDCVKAADWIRQAVAAYPDTPFYHNNLGLALLGQGGNEAAAAAFQQALDLAPDYVEARINLGRALRAAGRTGRAMDCFVRALTLDPRSAVAHAQMGGLLGETGRSDRAAEHLEKALSLDPDLVTVRHDLAGVYHDQGRLDAAEAGYRDVNARQPHLVEPLNNLGTVLHDLGRTGEAMVCFRRALSLDPEQAEAHNNLGNLLQDTGRMEEAAESYRRAIAIDPGFAKAYNNLGMACHETGQGDLAVSHFKKALVLEPGYAEACAHLVHQLQRNCDWEALPEAQGRLDVFTEKALSSGGAVAEQPFVSLVRGASPQRQLAIARTWAERAARPANGSPTPFSHPQPKTGDRPLTIGYLSANFRNHPMAHLMASLFELHDRGRFRVHGYAFGPDDGSVYRRRIADGCDRFVDIDVLGHGEAAARIHDDGVDILVDLMGHTKGNRMAICAARPAPVQARYLGLAGTTGADCFDYIICDRTVVPPSLAVHYSETPIYMPHCYQVNDHRQPVSRQVWTRKEAGLPETGPVLCCFNHAYKFDPVMFDAWMAIVNQVPGSVLWLLAPPETARRHLLDRAGRSGVEAGRLVFAPKLAKPEHLARLNLADLGLDTRLVSGAATTSDALWAGVPVVTVRGDQFASNMSASILSAIGLSELVTDTLDRFVSLATALATDRSRLVRLRRRLAENRKTAPLFDTHRFVRDLETGLETAWERYCSGLAPVPIDIGEIQ